MTTVSRGSPRIEPGNAHMKLLENSIQHWRHVGLLGVIVGLPVGLVLEHMRQRAFQADVRQATTEFASFGMDVVMFDPLKPWVVPFCTTAGFTAISLAIYGIVFAVRKHKRA